MPRRLSIFPLTGAILFPDLQMPLHIFEPRYRALVSDALARDRRIAMIQPRSGGDSAFLPTPRAERCGVRELDYCAARCGAC